MLYVVLVHPFSLLHSIPLYEYITIYLHILLLIDTPPNIPKPSMLFLETSSNTFMYTLLLGIYLGADLWVNQLIPAPSVCESFICSLSLLTIIINALKLSILKCIVVTYCGFNLCFPND